METETAQKIIIQIADPREKIDYITDGLKELEKHVLAIRGSPKSSENLSYIDGISKILELADAEIPGSIGSNVEAMENYIKATHNMASSMFSMSLYRDTKKTVKELRVAEHELMELKKNLYNYIV